MVMQNHNPLKPETMDILEEELVRLVNKANNEDALLTDLENENIDLRKELKDIGESDDWDEDVKQERIKTIHAQIRSNIENINKINNGDTHKKIDLLASAISKFPKNEEEVAKINKLEYNDVCSDKDLKALLRNEICSVLVSVKDIPANEA